MNRIEAIRKRKNLVRGVIYARFSSDMQRDESIDAQVRAIQEYAQRNNIVLVGEYIDKARSATTDQRPRFQQMIADSTKDMFDVVLVHKLDRFARNRSDSIGYRMELKRHEVALISITEYIDDSPESIILESVLEAMAEYYSRNLAREVEKGKKENALKGRHVGGVPPLGYDLDRNTMMLTLNESEAEAVKLIFRRYLEGASYKEISAECNRLGYTTKYGNRFGANSMISILRNPKYTGVYTYNRCVSKDVDGKRNGHKYKPEDEIIRVEGVIPAIVSKEDFEAAQAKMKRYKQRAASYKAKQVYLLSGKLVCGVCGSAYCGNSRRARPDHPLYVSYRCIRQNKKANCKNPEIRRDTVDSFVLDKLAHFIFDDRHIPELMEGYNDYLLSRNGRALEQREAISAQLESVGGQIDNLVDLVARTASAALLDKLGKLEEEKAELERERRAIGERLQGSEITEDKLREMFADAREKLKSGTLPNVKAVVERCVNRVVLYPDYIEVYLNFGFYGEQALPVPRLIRTKETTQTRKSALFLHGDVHTLGGEGPGSSSSSNFEVLCYEVLRAPLYKVSFVYATTIIDKLPL